MRENREASPATLYPTAPTSPDSMRAKHGASPGLAGAGRGLAASTRAAFTPHPRSASASASAASFANPRGVKRQGPGRVAASAKVTSSQWRTAFPPVGRRATAIPSRESARSSHPAGKGSLRPRLKVGRSHP